MKSRTIYLLLALGFVVSVAIAAVQPVGDYVRVVASVPAAAAVVAAMFQMLRDQIAHDRARSLQNAQNGFAMGATSHMAQLAFDKHVAFSEAYIAELFLTLTTLFREGPTGQVFEHTRSLYAIRQLYAVWLTPSIESELDRFELALRKIGANAHFVEVDLAHPKRSEAIDEMYDLYKEVTSMTEGDVKTIRTDRAILTIIQSLRRVLGIEELTQLRQKLVSAALETTG